MLIKQKLNQFQMHLENPEYGAPSVAYFSGETVAGDSLKAESLFSFFFFAFFFL